MSVVIQSQLKRALNLLVDSMTPSIQQDESVRAIRPILINKIAIRIFLDYAYNRGGESYFKGLLDEVLKGVKPLAGYKNQLEIYAAGLQGQESPVERVS